MNIIEIICYKFNYKADFHPWLIRQTASAAFNAVPKREFVLSVLGDNATEKCAMLQCELTKLNRTLD